MNLHFYTACLSDAAILANLRVAAMRPSLEALGRFDQERARSRFLDSFSPQNTQKIVMDEALVGFYVLENRIDHYYLSHLYLAPSYQRLNIGSVVIEKIKAQARQEQLPIRLGALRGSRSNAFYTRHGFVKTHEDQFDIYYECSFQEETEFD